jgi:hypothetical protein
MGNASEVVREVSVNDFRVATEQQLFHLDHRLLGIAPGAVADGGILRIASGNVLRCPLLFPRRTFPVGQPQGEKIKG